MSDRRLVIAAWCASPFAGTLFLLSLKPLHSYFKQLFLWQGWGDEASWILGLVAHGCAYFAIYMLLSYRSIFGYWPWDKNR